MKKFFKALALVLALTLVIGTVPASAATTINAKKEKTLYVGGTKGFKVTEDGTTVLSKYKAKATFASLLGITKAEAKELEVTAESSDSTIVKVQPKLMKIKAVGMGTANVTLKTNNGSSYTVAVTVKQSATKVIFGRDFKENKDRDDLKAYVTYQVSVPRSENGVKMDTDNRRLIVKDAEGNDVTADVATKVIDEKEPKKDTRLWNLKFTKTGVYTLIGEAFQSAKSYPGATATSTPLTVTVNEGEIDTFQTAYNAFKMTFSAAELAKVARDATEPSLKEGYAAVTEDTEVIKVFQIGEAGKGEEKISVFIKSFYLKDNELTVTTFDDLREDTTYQIEYHGYATQFKACKWVPASISNYYVYTPNMDEKGGTAKLYTTVNATGEKGQDVNITDKVMAMGSVEYEDGNAKNDFTKYTVAGDQVDFYVDDYTASVKAKFTYYGTDGTINKDNTFNVQAKDTRKFGVVYYDMVAEATGNAGDPATKREAFISADEGNKYLRVRIAVDMDGDGVYDDDYNGDQNPNARSLDYLFSSNPDVTFKTSNNDKLVVQENDGLAYAPKVANEKVGVYVYFRGTVVDGDTSTPNIDPIYVNIYDKKTLGDLEVTAKTDKKYSYSDFADTAVIYSIDTDFEKFYVKAKDQFGNQYDGVSITVEKVTDVLDPTTTAPNNDVVIYAGADNQNLNYAALKTTPGSASIIKNGTYNVPNNSTLYFAARSADNAVRTVSFKITAVDNVSKKKIVKTFSFTVKNTNESKVVAQAVEKIGGYEYRVIGKDSAGYRVCGYFLDTEARIKSGTSTAEVYLGFYKNKNGDLMVPVTPANGTTKSVTMKTVTNIVGGGLTKISDVTKGLARTVSPAAVTVVTSGSAISVAQYKTTHDAYVESTSYSARAYKRNNAGAMYVISSTSFDFAPANTYKVAWTWTDAYSENVGIETVIDEAIKFTTYQWEWVAWKNANDWVAKDSNVKFSNIGYRDVVVSYAEKNDSITLLYVYVLDNNGIYIETPIVRSVYTNVTK